MGVFNIIETFFFLSLAITFILILLLVNHFKQRLSLLEQKCDTMFEIINNIVREITNLKMEINMHAKESVREQIINPTIKEQSSTIPIYNTNTYVIKDDQSDNEDSDDSDDSSDSEDSTDSEESIDNDDNYDIQKENITENETIYIQFDTPILTEQIIEFPTESVKIINIDMEDYSKPASNDVDESEPNIQVSPNDNNNIYREEYPSMNEENDEDKEEDIVSNDEESDKSASINEDYSITNDEVAQSPNHKNAPIYVSKLDESEEIDTHTQEEKKESYKDLTINQLKAIVISKGITTSVSKLKKNELIQLLENN